MRGRSAGVVVLMVALGTTALVLALTRSAGAGPYGDGEGGACCGSSESFVPEPGQMIGIDYVLPTLSKPVVLLAVRPLHPEDARGLTFRYAAKVDDDGAQVNGFWRDAAGHARPLAGFVVPAHHRPYVVIGISSKRRGSHYVRGFIIDYRIGGTTYSAPQSFGVKVCAGTRRCPL